MNGLFESKKEERNYVKEVGSFIWEIIKVIVLAFVIIVPIRVFLFQPFFVQGASMEPNFEDGEYLIVNELGFKQTEVGTNSFTLFTVNSFREIKRQSVVVFRYPIDSRKYFIKRIIGLPGEKIQIKNGAVTIFNGENPNGLILDERNYLSPASETNGNIVVTLENDEYFVLGDNRKFSSDSRAWGPVSKKYIMGEVLIRAWPLNKINVF